MQKLDEHQDDHESAIRAYRRAQAKQLLTDLKDAYDKLPAQKKAQVRAELRSQA